MVEDDNALLEVIAGAGGLRMDDDSYFDKDHECLDIPGDDILHQNATEKFYEFLELAADSPHDVTPQVLNELETQLEEAQAKVTPQGENTVAKIMQDTNYPIPGLSPML